MAGVTLTAQQRNTSDVATIVYAKRRWADAWVRMPFLWCRSCTDTLAPSVPEAQLESRFGYMRRAEIGSWATYAPYLIDGAYIKVVALDRFNATTVWVGVADLENVFPHGDTTRASGVQNITAYGLEHLMDRRAMHGAYTENGFIDRPITFNRVYQHGMYLIGNQGSGYQFGVTAGATWSNLDIINYIITHYLDDIGISWQIIGDYALLDSIVEEHDFEGLTPWQAINRLIERHRGLAWRVVTDGSGTAYIAVFSLHNFPVTVGDVTVPANSFQQDVVFASSRSVQPTITFNRQNTYDRIIVKGGPIYSCFSLSMADGTLAPGWKTTGVDFDSETEYKAGSDDSGADAKLHDAERATAKFRNVYRRFGLPGDWDGKAGSGLGSIGGADPVLYDAMPGCTPRGFPLADYHPLGKPVYITGKYFERELPLQMDGHATTGTLYTQKEYRTPFAVVEVDDPDNPGSTVYAYTHKLDAFDLTPFSIAMNDTGPGIILSAQPNHLVALNHFDTADAGTSDSNTEPQVDYETMIVTVMMETDIHVKVDTAVLGYGTTETGRTKAIYDNDAVVWYIVPNTVIEVTDGELVHHDGGYVRDDSERIRLIAARAMSWYGQPRSQIEWTAQYVDLAAPAGSMIRSMIGPEGVTLVNSMVTSRVWNFEPGQQSTRVQTGFVELEFTRRGPEQRARQRLRRIAKLRQRQAKIPQREA